MKKKSFKIIIALMIAVIMVLSLAACGDKPEKQPKEGPVKAEQPRDTEPQNSEQGVQQTDRQNTQAAETRPEENKEDPKPEEKSEENKEDPKPGDRPEDKPEEKKDEKIRVSSVEEFADAIKEGAHIVIAPGYYNMSGFLEDAWARYGEGWNSNHLYTALDDCYDGTGLLINRVQNLIIEGEGEVELVIDPRYANVLSFVNCGNVTLKNMTLGHTERGECAGDVIYLADCENVVMKDMDLYGCGVIGIESAYCTDITVSDSVIHDCSDCGISIRNSYGSVIFNDCSIVDNDSGISLYDNVKPAVFNRCVFSQAESSSVFWLDNVELNDCILEDPDTGYYPDVEPQWEIGLEPQPIDIDMLIMNDWKAYSGFSEYDIMLEFDPEFENDVMLHFFQDSTGSLDNYYFEGDRIFWWTVDEEYNYAALFDSTEAEYGFAELRMYHDDAPADGDPEDYIELVAGEDVIYLRPYPAY